MTNCKNTGNYRLSREKKRYDFGKPISSFSCASEATVAKNKIQKEDPEGEYFCEEEVIFEKTHSDNDENQYDSEPTWRRLEG